MSTVLVTIPSVHVTMPAPYPYPPIAREMGLVVIELHSTASSPLHHNIYILQCYKDTRRRREGLREGEEKIVLDGSREMRSGGWKCLTFLWSAFN